MTCAGPNPEAPFLDTFSPVPQLGVDGPQAVTPAHGMNVAEIVPVTPQGEGALHPSLGNSIMPICVKISLLAVPGSRRGVAVCRINKGNKLIPSGV